MIMAHCPPRTWPAVRSFLKASSAKLQAPRPALMMPQLKNRLKIERNK